MSEIVVYDDGPRELRHMWLSPSAGDYSDDNGFLWLWRFWTWFDLNADYGSPTWAGSIVSGFRMAWRRR
jgi:hypothetical protein